MMTSEELPTCFDGHWKCSPHVLVFSDMPPYVGDGDQLKLAFLYRCISGHWKKSLFYRCSIGGHCKKSLRRHVYRWSVEKGLQIYKCIGGEWRRVFIYRYIQ